MRDKELDALIAAHLTGTISDSDLARLNKWLKDPENLVIFKNLEMVWQEDSQEPILRNTHRLLDKHWSLAIKKERSFPWKWVGLAASVTLILICSFLVANQGNLSPENEIELWVTHQNPSGQKSKIHLSDGTVVWLNALSSLSYKKGFTDSTRIIELKGQAYFDVAKDTGRVFEVIANDISITALGTSFDVNAYPEEWVAKVALVNGKVGVKRVGDAKEQLILSPGEEVTYVQKTNSFLKGRFNHDEIMGWKEGLLYFNGATYAQVMTRLERWYGVEIDTKGDFPKDWALTAQFENQSLENVLKNLKFQKKFDYELIDGDKVILSF